MGVYSAFPFVKLKDVMTFYINNI